MNDARVSVAMCTYNASRYCEEQLESILAQSHLPDEVVVCDDGSQDGTLEILESFRRKAAFPVRIFVNERNLGRTKNFESAIKRCTGSIIALSDFDDVWKRDKLRYLCAAFESHPEAGYAFSDGDLIDADGKSLGACMWDRHLLRKQLRAGFPPESQVPVLLVTGVATGAAMAFCASLKPYILPIPERWVQDYWISIVASFAGFYGVALPEALLRYRLHTAQMTGIRPSFLERYRRSLASSEDGNVEQLAEFQELHERLVGDPAIAVHCKVQELVLLEQKIAHLSERIRARSSRGRRKFGIVIAEARTGRYQQFSYSWLSAVRDLCS